MPCIHQSGVLRKETIKGVQLPQGVAVKCPLCYALGLRNAFFQMQSPSSPRLKPNAAFLEIESFEAGVENFWSSSNEARRSFVVEERRLARLSLEDAPACSFPIRKGENGETYHGLLAALLAPSVKVEISGASPAQVDFLNYYLEQDKIFKDARDSGARTECTAYIAKAFEANSKKQEALHQYLRDYFSDKILEDVLKNPYTKTSSLSKYYINRYLSESSEILDGPRKLPKAHEVGRIGLIFVRRAHTAGDGRMMTVENLRGVLDSLAQLNESLARAGKAEEVLTSHVILFGDIKQDEVQKLQRDFHGRLRFIHLPSPFFETNSEALKALRGVGAYAEFSDYAPLEAKLFSIFIALRERYGSRLFGVGFRSGTLDGAGFLGIPVFYFDDTTSKEQAKYKQYYESGEYLINPDKDKAVEERVLTLTRSVNTFIRINNLPVKNNQGFIQLDDKALLHLRAALWIWMCTLPPANQAKPLWMQRVLLMRDTTKRAKFLEWLGEATS
ncbi:hypothetical protein [Cystobacter ferrugineus]|uniref:Uncharacterized protein n=1 Tax=Cystobacter ferrugineus TaxID=83449 RepID=A0A1L9BCJ3_9BACT|nr:hypothetical protein [Cystobacter ferrugineus]OJH39965.1 hypothetical protein BON30_12865 [Cystobacter ferrugineus]